MIFYRLSTQKKNGQIEVLTTEFADNTVITIGRSETSHIRLEGTQVSLNHAIIYEQKGNLFIEDKNSFGGTKVNNRLVTRKKLDDDDIIEIGDSQFTIDREKSTEGKNWALLETRLLVDRPAEESFVKALTQRLDHSKRFPSMLLLSCLAALLVIAPFLFLPLETENLESWNSGPISNQHHSLSNDCRTCHVVPFQKVNDETCLTCHNMSEHNDKLAESEQVHQHQKISCATCHMEHNGSDGLTIKDSQLCTSCHTSLSTKYPDTKVLDVASVATHPQFHLQQLRSDGIKEKVSLGEKRKIKDTNTLKLNHKLHLTPNLAGPNGGVTLGCDSCHKFTGDRRSFAPITFEGECQSCHPLAISGGSEISGAPHGEPNQLYQFLRKYYSELLLEKEGRNDQEEGSRKKPSNPVTRGEALEFSRQQVEKQARTSEEQLFEKTSCVVCHEISENAEKADLESSKYHVQKPSIPRPWFKHAVFDHVSHDNISCESCHEGVSDSEQTSDVLLPGVANCQSCHHDSGKNAMVETSCVTCHSFHEQKPLAEHKKMKLK